MTATSAAENPLANFRHRSWTQEEGLPSDEVRVLLQTRDGYLWIGTRTGLARFDGIRFTVFNRSNTPEMVSETITALAEDTLGHLWVGTTEGLLSWDGQSMRRPAYPAGKGEEFVTVLCAGSDGSLWIGTHGGFFLWKSGKWSFAERIEEPTHAYEPHIVALCEDSGKGLWVGNIGRLWYLDMASEKLSRLPEPPAPALLAPAYVSREEDGSLLAVLADQPREETRYAVHRLKNGQWIRYADPKINNGGRPPCLGKDAKGALLLASWPGKMYRFDRGAFTLVPLPKALRDDRLLCALEDREGNLWLGTEAGGLHQMQPRKIFSLSSRDGLAHENTKTILETRDGSVWIGTDGGLSRLLAGLVTNLTEKDGLARKDVRALAEDQAGRLWIGTGSGLNCLENGRLIHHQFPGEWFQTKIRALQTGRDGGLWVGALKGLHLLHEGRRSTWTGTNGLVNDDARAVFQDRAGAVWIGSDGAGLFRLREGQLTRFTTTNGLASDHVFGFYEDADGVLWFGSERGLHRLQNGRFTVFDSRHGLFDGVIKQVLEDDFGHLWFSGERVVGRVRRTELNDIAAGRARLARVTRYDESDGLLSSETNGQLSQPAGCKTRDGRLWFPTNKGVVIIDPRTLQAAELPPPVVIEQIRADDETVLGDGSRAGFQPAGSAGIPARSSSQVEGTTPGPQTGKREARIESKSEIKNRKSKVLLPPGRGRVLEFSYTANTFIAPEKARFKYRLDGYDRDWHDAGTRRVAYYTNLRPGDYRFRVQAANHHNVWNETGAALAFYLAPFFYQTWSFRIGCVLALALAVFIIVRWRIGEVRRIERLEKQAALVEERTRLARDLHDGLGADLTQLTMLADLAGQEAPAPGQAHQIARTARNVLHSLKDFIWAVHPVDGTLDGLVSQVCQQAEDLLGRADLRVRFDVPAELPALPVPAALRQDILFTAREAVNNIVHHAAASEVRIRAALNDASFALSIEDNGRGFDPQQSTNNHQPARSGHGLPNMRERIESLPGRFRARSQAGKGTTIEIEIPLRLLRDK